MYTGIDFKTKKSMAEAVEGGAIVSVYSPGPFGGAGEGAVFLEGPHWPAAHKWYARAIVKDGAIVPGSVK